jgi:NADPH-dependent glutamate synthase beta subunit-like oxidoreductase
MKGFEKAISVMANDISLPLVCWYTCFHPERAKMDEEIYEKGLKTLIDEHKKIRSKSELIYDEKVAVVGSGPAGLTAAGELAKMGYPVTVFEALPAPGGMLRKSMPSFRLPRNALESEIEQLKQFNIEFKIDTEVGKDVSFAELQREYKAVFLAVGAHKNRMLGINGEGLSGVIDALDFLWGVNRGQSYELGKRVGVVGGGNVAVDAARTVLRVGEGEVKILYRRSREEMPANPWEIKEAEDEGVKFQFLVSPQKIIEKGGKVEGMELIKMELGEPDNTGRRTPLPIEGSEFTIELDTIIVAIGETANIDFLPKEIKVDRGSRILVDPFTMETNLLGVFAGGDAVTGPATIMEAILAGKKAANSINRYLKHANKEGENVDK